MKQEKSMAEQLIVCGKPYRIPSHDTMERIFAMLNPKEFQERFIAWVQHACGKQSREIISVDGKTMRGSGSEEQKPIHMVSAWANKAKAVFGQMARRKKDTGE